LEDPKQAQILVKSAPDLLKQMKKYGIKTRAQFNAFIEDYPALQTNQDLFNKLDAAYPNPLSTKDMFGIIATAGVDTVKAIKEAYNDMNIDPACNLK
jgi:hypothetical protein